MLYKIIVDKFRSFGEPAEIVLYPNSKRVYYQEHVYQGEPFPVLKHCLVVGPNGCGKTNLVSAIAFLKEFCGGGLRHDPKDEWLRHWYYDNRFNLPVAEDEAPIHMLAEFSHKGTLFIYSVSFDGEGVKIETLYKVPGARLRPVVLMMRTRDKVEFNKEFHVSGETVIDFHNQLVQNPETSALVINANLRLVDEDVLLHAHEWFHDKLVVSLGDYSFPRLMDMYCDTPQSLEFTNILLRKMGIGCTVSVKESKPSDWLKSAGAASRNLLSLFEGGDIAESVHSYEDNDIAIRSSGRRKVIRELEFVQHGANGFRRAVKPAAQSSGTIHLLSVMALLYQAIFTDRTVVADGLDTGINSASVKDLCKLFCESKSKGQLFYTSNSLMPMNQQEMIRVDETWLMEKRDGSSAIISLDKFSKVKIKALLSLERNYLDGRFGARPGMPTTEDIEGIGT